MDAMLRSLIDSLVLRIDLFTVSTILLKEQTLANQSHFSFVSKLHGFKTAILILQKGLSHHQWSFWSIYLEVKGSIQTSQLSTTSQQTVVTPHYSMLYCITSALDSIYHIQMDPCTQWWPHSIYVAWPHNTQHPTLHQSLFISIHPICLHPSNLLPSELNHTSSVHFTKLSWHIHVLWPHWYAAPIIVENMWNKEEIGQNDGSKGDKVPLRDNEGHSWKMYLRRWLLV